MAKKTLGVPIGDLQKLRITCLLEECGAIVEVSLGNLHKLGSAKCPICSREFNWPQQTNAATLLKLQSAIQEATAMNKRLGIEFVLPGDGLTNPTATPAV